MKMDLTAECGWCDGISRVGRWVLVCSILLLMVSQAASAQKSVTAQSMERQGMVDVTTLDSTIHVSLMYARPDNFTGKVLYADLREALLHPRAQHLNEKQKKRGAVGPLFFFRKGSLNSGQSAILSSSS